MVLLISAQLTVPPYHAFTGHARREWRGQIEIGAWTDQSKTVSWADYALGGLCVGGLKKMPWTDFAVGKFCIS
jgi:hypothetical protein